MTTAFKNWTFIAQTRTEVTMECRTCGRLNTVAKTRLSPDEAVTCENCGA